MPIERKVAKHVEIVHRCDCATATETPGEDGPDHVLRIDGQDFPWHITEKGPEVRRLDERWYTVTVEIFAEKVDAVGVPIWEHR